MKKKRQDIIAYFEKLDRSDFIGKRFRKYAIDPDAPMSIGFGQTISQASLVLDMTIELDPQEEDRVLEIGTGSGYQTALLAPFCREVYTVERITKLHNQAKKRLHEKGWTNIHYRLGDGNKGWPEHQPYDRIMVTAAVSEIPDALLEQLAPGGKMLIPVGTHLFQELQIVEKSAIGTISIETLYGVRFVQLLEGTE